MNKILDIWGRWNCAKKCDAKKTPKVAERSEIWNEVKDEIPKIKKSIEQKFRKIIGI